MNSNPIIRIFATALIVLAGLFASAPHSSAADQPNIMLMGDDADEDRLAALLAG